MTGSVCGHDGSRCGCVVVEGSEYVAYSLADLEVYRGPSAEIARDTLRNGGPRPEARYPSGAELACAVADAWAEIARSGLADLIELRRDPGALAVLRVALERLEAMTRASNFRKVRP